MARAATGRQRYQWLLLLLVAGLLRAWMLVEGTQRDDSDVDGSAAPSETASSSCGNGCDGASPVPLPALGSVPSRSAGMNIDTSRITAATSSSSHR